MFKPVKWRSERNRIKAVFKLQFHLTQVQRSVSDGLVIHLIPVELGRSTTKVEKGIIRDGSYYWENPVYETVKFNLDSRNSPVSPRIYQFRITNGYSKADLVGEVCVNFSDYIDATKPSSVSLPLKNSNLNLVLHVLIQRVQDNVINRNAEKSEAIGIKSPRTTLKAQLSFEETDECIATISIENDSFDEKTSQTLESDKASSESNLALSSSESSSGNNTPRTNGCKESNIQEERESNNLSSSRSQPDWSSENSETSTQSVDKLKNDLEVLSRQAELSELEVYSLRKQIIKESKRAQELSKEVNCLKEEREALREEIEELKTSYTNGDGRRTRNNPRLDNENSQALIEELRQELYCEKEMNSNYRVQIQKMQESNSELILAVQDLESMLEQKNKEILDIQDRNAEELDEEQKALEELVKEHRDAEKGYLLEQKILDLVNEVEICKREKDEVEIQIEQLALDYEILKQENHDLSCKLGKNTKASYNISPSSVALRELETQVENLEGELKMESEKSSESVATINGLEINVKNLEDELEKQGIDFDRDLNLLTCEKVEQEKRAIQAEEALRKTVRRNSKIAERLQEELKEFSMQMASAFDESEKTAIKASSEADNLRIQKNHLEEVLRHEREKLKILVQSYDGRLQELADEIKCKTLDMEAKILKIEDSYEEETKAYSNELRFLIDENERLRSAVGNLRASLFEDGVEREKLRKQVYQMKDELKKKEDDIAIVEKKLKSYNGVITAGSDGSRETLRSKNSLSPTQGSKVACNLRERIKLLEGEIQLRETDLESSTKDFLEKEKNFLHKIDELQRNIEELSQKNCKVPEIERRKECSVFSNEGEHEKQLSKADDELLKETTLLRDTNRRMEHELKEMQERYSEISLKFAEVEGERQMLVMTLRNLKNATKI